MSIALSSSLAATQTALLASQFNGGFIRIFSGVRPAAPEQAETGVLLAIVSVDGVSGAGLHFVSNGAALLKAAEPWQYTGLANGTASWFRIVAAGDTGLAAPSALRIDGSIGTPSNPGDITLDSLIVQLGVPYTFDSFIYLIQPVGVA